MVAHTGGQPVPAAFYLNVPRLFGTVQHALVLGGLMMPCEVVKPR